MKPPPFEYHRPDTLDEALAVLAQHGAEAKPLAGGQSLVPTMNFRLAQPAVLVDLNAVDTLAAIEPQRDGGLRLGAMTRQRAVERSDTVAERSPLLREVMPSIAHPQIRNRGTVGGSVAHADPAAELPAIMLLLEATFRLRSQGGDRWVPAADFFTGFFATALAEGELVTDVAIPAQPPGAGAAFDEIARRHGDYALVGAAALVTLDDAGRCARARLTLLSVGDGPVLAVAVGETLDGAEPTSEAIAAAASAAQAAVDPPSDIHASSEYRRHLVGVLARRVLTRAVDRAGPDR